MTFTNYNCTIDKYTENGKFDQLFYQTLLKRRINSIYLHIVENSPHSDVSE